MKRIVLTGVVCLCLFFLFISISDCSLAGQITRYACITGLCAAWIIKLAPSLPDGPTITDSQGNTWVRKNKEKQWSKRT